MFQNHSATIALSVSLVGVYGDIPKKISCQRPRVLKNNIGMKILSISLP